MEGTSSRPVTWQIHSYVTSTLGCPTVCTFGGTTWPPMPPCGWICETSSQTNTTQNGKARSYWRTPLTTLSANTEVIYQECLVKRENDKLVANSREATVKELLPDRQVAHAERQAWATPTNPDIASSSSQADLYPNWVRALITKPRGGDQPRPYRMPRQEADRDCMLEEELDAKSVFDPLFGFGSQSSQPLGSQSSTSPDTTMGAAGPKTLPHFSESLPTIPPFDLALLGLPAPMSPVMVGENTLLGLAPGSLVKSLAPPGIGHGARVLGRSSFSNSPMSLGSPAVTSSLTLALKVRARALMPALIDDANTDSSLEDSSSSDEEDMDAADNSPRKEGNRLSTHLKTHLKTTTSTRPARLYIGALPGWDRYLESIVFRWPAHLFWCTAVFFSPYF